MNCKNCSTNFEGNFCSYCGQKAKVDKINIPNFFDELTDSIFQINRGLLYTMKELFVRPGDSIREFILGKRKNHFKPIAYALTLSTIYFVLSNLLDKKTLVGELLSGFTVGTSGLEAPDFYSLTIDWLANNYAYTTLLMIPFYALSSYLAFLGKGYNYLENVVLNAYLVGQQAIIYAVFLLPTLFIADDFYLELVVLAMSIGYAFWTFRTFYTKLGWKETTFRTILVYLVNIILVIGLLTVFTLGAMLFAKQ